MQLLRNVHSFGATTCEMVHLWTVLILKKKMMLIIRPGFKIRRQFICEKFAKSGINYNKLTDLIPENVYEKK